MLTKFKNFFLRFLKNQTNVQEVYSPIYYILTILDITTHSLRLPKKQQQKKKNCITYPCNFSTNYLVFNLLRSVNRLSDYCGIQQSLKFLIIILAKLWFADS